MKSPSFSLHSCEEEPIQMRNAEKIFESLKMIEIFQMIESLNMIETLFNVLRVTQVLKQNKKNEVKRKEC